MRRLMPSGGQGYLSVQCRIATSSLPALRQTSRACSTSLRVAVPVESSIGLPTRAARSMRPWQVRSADAILNAGTSREARKSTASSSNGVENAVKPDLPRVPEERLEVAVGELVELVERIPLRALGVGGLEPVARGHAGGDLARGVALELDGVGAGRPRRLHELVAELDVAVVVDARLRDHVAGRALADGAAVDREGGLHAWRCAASRATERRLAALWRRWALMRARAGSRSRSAMASRVVTRRPGAARREKISCISRTSSGSSTVRRYSRPVEAGRQLRGHDLELLRMLLDVERHQLRAMARLAALPAPLERGAGDDLGQDAHEQRVAGHVGVVGAFARGGARRGARSSPRR